MPPPHAWLDDVRPSPYADQLALGFRRLRFVRSLEREYRRFKSDDFFELKRIALGVAMLLWLAFAAFDCFQVPQPYLAWILMVRLAVFALLLVCAGLILRRKHRDLLQALSLLCILALGVGAALVVGIAHQADPNYPYEGLLLVSMAAYFVVGLRLGEALFCAAVVLLVYLGAELWAGLPAARLSNNLLFLLFGNLIGALGCYLLEYKSREHFLISRLMQILAEHDSLTGLHNRRSFNRHFARLLGQARRAHQSLALLLCDIDHFKAYNDCHGHQTGDRALQRVGTLLQDAARRPLDIAVRLGGEEFAVLLYDIPAAEAGRRAEALRIGLEQQMIEHPGSATAPVLTMSVGVACLSPADSGEMAQLYERADRALYEAKAFGRNRVVA